MITVKEAELLIQQYFPMKLGKDTLKVNSSKHGKLAEDILSDRSYPPFHRVMMDGIAVNFQSYQQGTKIFPIEDISAAGHPRKELKNKDHAIEVMTGCPLPLNCNLVIPYEHLEIKNDVAQITNEVKRAEMDHIHFAGSDIDQHQIVLEKGSLFDGPSAGIAASMGYSQVEIEKHPKILIVSTGDELVPVESEPEYFQLRISNSYAIQRSLKINGYLDCERVHLKDDYKTLSVHFAESIGKYNIIIYSGGVSKGKFDYLPQVWEEHQVEKKFHGISQRPGKPMWFGVHPKTNTLIFGLPGNPVSSLICLHRYLLKRSPIFVELQENLEFKGNLTLFKPVTISFDASAKIMAKPISIKNSGEFTALQGSKGFIELPQGKNQFLKGEVFPFYPWDTLI